MGSVLAPCSPHHLGSGDLLWHVPEYPCDRGNAGGGVRACRSFEPGEMVERCWCLAIGHDHLAKSYLEEWCPLCPPVPAEKGRRMAPPCSGEQIVGQKRLVPTGWGLLFERDAAKANLKVEYHLAELPPAPSSSAVSAASHTEEDEDENDDRKEPCLHHWLVFRTTRRVEAGESLYVTPLPEACLRARGAIHRSVFSAARAATGCDTCPTLDDPESLLIYMDDDAPEYVPPPDKSIVVTGASTIHGIGGFAARDIQPDEIVCYVPMLPILISMASGNAIGDYIWASDWEKNSDIVFWGLGHGGLYNHDDVSPNIEPRSYVDQPFVQAWVATQFIPKGSELFVSYGDEYWAEKGKPRPPPRRRHIC
eukprot:gnl/TRDRNA2_/TRDRNA2_41638_c1_seq1.p1 gnl/TRDRNA2_/TRDRNA2_41638_c1~~gnl/TRDRNA2_/TRDRNA2_41638_c1_seq1.p1  ORF type:complete len:365 (-),score=48.62 gnl/TRDRNA2_/TRDRNA2_41638_c1_seq1:72-1166(-)